MVMEIAFDFNDAVQGLKPSKRIANIAAEAATYNANSSVSRS
jgi:hypothetical protein